MLFGGYVASTMIGESIWFTLTIVVGIAGLAGGAIALRNAGVPGLPSWRANPYLFSLVTAALHFSSGCSGTGFQPEIR